MIAVSTIPVNPSMKSQIVVTVIVFWLSTLVSRLLAQEKIDLARLPIPAGLVSAGTEATRAALVCFYEDPAVDGDGNVYFSDITSNRILKLSSDGVISVFRENSGRANGNAFDAQGRLITCEGFGLGPGGDEGSSART